MTQELDAEFAWQRCPDAAALLSQLLRTFSNEVPAAATLESRMLGETGTRLIDWVDHWCLPSRHPSIGKLSESGFIAAESLGEQVWNHPGGLFPPIRSGDFDAVRLAVRVDSVADFLFAHRVDAPIEGRPMSPFRTAKVASAPGCQLWVVERHGAAGFAPREVTNDQIAASLQHQESFCRRRREFADDRMGFEHAGELVGAAIDDLGVDWACDLFFAAERRYWQSRNRAAQLQKRRQDRLGLGWANHDHHTYRSSRENFTRLVGLLEQLGFCCRERFSA